MLEEMGIGANPDLEYGDSSVIWIHENYDVRPALKFLREQNILATEYQYCRRIARRISRIVFSASSEFRSTFDLISAPSAIKMSQKSSLPQSLHSVQLVLTGNKFLNLFA